MGTGPWRCRLKDLFEFAQGLGARESWLGDPGLAAGHDVQHPERHFQNPRCLDVLQAAVRHRPAAFYESGMHPYCPAVPRMPGIADFTKIPNMGVVLLSCTIGGELTCRSAKMHPNPEEYSLERRVLWSRLVKWAVCIITTNAAPPNTHTIRRQHRIECLQKIRKLRLVCSDAAIYVPLGTLPVL
jgi:hypothetical protein